VEKLRFLDQRDERLMLGVPWIAALVAAIVWLGSRINVSWSRDNDLVLLVTSLLFLDGLHVTFTFIAVLGLSELRDWARPDEAAANSPASRLAAASRGFWGRVFFVGVALAAVFYFIRFSPWSRTLPAFAAIFLLFEALGPSQHTLAQMRGISFCFHSSLRKAAPFSAEELKSALQVERWEKNLFRVLLAADVLSAIPNILIRAGYAGPRAHPLMLQAVRGACVSVMALAVAGILYNGALYPRQGLTNKMAYLLRTVLYPLRIFVLPAHLVVRACHGTEYLVIVRQLIRNSNATETTRRRMRWATIGVSILYGAIFALTFPFIIRYWARWREPQGLVVYAMMATLVIRYLHYYMDAVLYRMNDAKVRAVVGPLLVRAGSSVPVGA
jgi:hypothetical protein